MDPVGVILVMAGIISFVLAVEYGGQKHPWNSSVVIGLLVGAVLIWVVFGAWEIYQGERATLPPRLLRQRSVWQPALFQFFFAGGYFILLYYLPIYFQSVSGTSPIQSGVRNLPLVIAIGIGSTVSGIIVSKTGHAAPFMLGGAILTTISAGLLYTLDIGTGSGKWIGYQIFYGGSIGLAFQMAMNISQANAKPQEISTVTAIVFCKFHLSNMYPQENQTNFITTVFQTIGGAYSVSAAQSGFVNRLISTLATSAPGVDPQTVVATGATQIRTMFDADQVTGIVFAYMAGVKVTFALVVALTGITCLLGVFAPWKRINVEELKETGGGIA
jgi:MFS transporter, DHA2 family, glioxin efflux transporter